MLVGSSPLQRLALFARWLRVAVLGRLRDKSMVAAARVSQKASDPLSGESRENDVASNMTDGARFQRLEQYSRALANTFELCRWTETDILAGHRIAGCGGRGTRQLLCTDEWPGRPQ